MKYQLVIEDGAIHELTEACSWYESQYTGLGNEFLLCIRQAFEIIENFPKAYKVVFKNIHRFSIRRFPYSIFYTIEKNIIAVIAIFHNRREPNEWKNR